MEKLNIKVIILLLFIFLLLNSCNTDEPKLEISLQEYLEYQEKINNENLDIDLESYMYCKDSNIIYSNVENNEVETECKTYSISIQKLFDDIIYEIKHK